MIYLGLTRFNGYQGVEEDKVSGDIYRNKRAQTNNDGSGGVHAGIGMKYGLQER